MLLLSLSLINTNDGLGGGAGIMADNCVFLSLIIDLAFAIISFICNIVKNTLVFIYIYWLSSHAV